MKYSNITAATFISRPNRFVAIVEIDGEREEVHVKNTGRCEELLIPGVTVYLVKSDNESRKTKYDLVAVERGEYGVINIDSQAPNSVVKEWLESGNSPFEGITYIKPEYSYGGSRIDFYIEQGDVKTLIEVKGCTLVKNGLGFFPDAPTDRGVKHLHELRDAVLEGEHKAALVFLIQVNNINYVFPNRETQPEFADALKEAIKAGVKVIFLASNVEPQTLEYNDYIMRQHL